MVDWCYSFSSDVNLYLFDGRSMKRFDDHHVEFCPTMNLRNKKKKEKLRYKFSVSRCLDIETVDLKRSDQNEALSPILISVLNRFFVHQLYKVSKEIIFNSI